MVAKSLQALIHSTRLYTDYSYEDSGWCVAGEEEGGIVVSPSLTKKEGVLPVPAGIG